eukprot:scaffold8178_cov296-Pinguiococcus_pyrenoidosus.AAC.5
MPPDAVALAEVLQSGAVLEKQLDGGQGNLECIAEAAERFVASLASDLSKSWPPELRDRREVRAVRGPWQSAHIAFLHEALRGASAAPSGSGRRAPVFPSSARCRARAACEQSERRDWRDRDGGGRTTRRRPGRTPADVARRAADVVATAAAPRYDARRW